VATAKKTFNWQSSKEGELLREDSFKDWIFSRPLALRPIYWEALEIIIDLPLGFPINNIISLYWESVTLTPTSKWSMRRR